MCVARHVTVSGKSGFLLKEYLSGIPLVRERASGWREMDENVRTMSSQQLTSERLFMLKPADDVSTQPLAQTLWNAFSCAQILLLAAENVLS